MMKFISSPQSRFLTSPLFSWEKDEVFSPLLESQGLLKIYPLTKEQLQKLLPSPVSVVVRTAKKLSDTRIFSILHPASHSAKGNKTNKYAE